MANAVVTCSCIACRSGWDQRPDYLAYTDWTPIPGVTSYAVPRNGSGTNVTSFHPGQAFLSEHILPDIMYQLHPCAEWRRFKETPLPEPKRNPDGSLVYEQWTRPGGERKALLDFKILPDKVSTEEAWWYIEFVRRMDPRIRLIDIIMREEGCAERSRMSDSRYINLHLNTPGYRVYRPAWKMISWQGTTEDAKKNKRTGSVLDSLTEAQRQANTTRGSTPGLIDPALGEVQGNRIDLPDLSTKKRGPKRATVNGNNIPATLVTQSAQVPQVSQASQAYQSHMPIPTMDFSLFHELLALTLLRGRLLWPQPPQGQDDLGGYMNARARDGAAMPPPPLPPRSRNGRSHRPQVNSPYPNLPDVANQSLGPETIRTDFEEAENVNGSNIHTSESEYPMISDEELATVASRSEEAMAEIHWMCEPFLDPVTNAHDPPPMELSAGLIDDLGIGILFPAQGEQMVRGRGAEQATPNPVQTMQARNVAQQGTPLLSERQRGKRKERNDENESFQHIQLDIERQERRPVKRVKSMTQQQQYLAPQLGNDQSGYGHGQPFGALDLQRAQPPQHASVEDTNSYTGRNSNDGQDRGATGQHHDPVFEPYRPQHNPSISSRTMFLNHQPYANSPYMPAPATGGQPSYSQPLEIPQSGLFSETSPHGNRQVSQTLMRPSPMSSRLSNGAQPTAARSRSKADRGHNEKPSIKKENSRRYHPYANSGRGHAQSMEAPQTRQLDGGYNLQPARIAPAKADNVHIPSVTPAPMEQTSSPNNAPSFPLDPFSEGFFIYKNNDPRQGLNVKATRQLMDSYLPV